MQLFWLGFNLEKALKSQFFSDRTWHPLLRVKWPILNLRDARRETQWQAAFVLALLKAQWRGKSALTNNYLLQRNRLVSEVLKEVKQNKTNKWPTRKHTKTQWRKTATSCLLLCARTRSNKNRFNHGNKRRKLNYSASDGPRFFNLLIVWWKDYISTSELAPIPAALFPNLSFSSYITRITRATSQNGWCG